MYNQRVNSGHTDSRAEYLAAAIGLPFQPHGRRLFQDVEQAAKAVFGTTPAPRPSRLIDELKALKTSIVGNPFQIPEIPRYVWTYLGVEDPVEIKMQELLSSPDRLAKELDSAIAMLEANAATVLDRRGGRRSDPRMHQFAMALAQIFEIYTGQRPTITFDPATGHMVSPFALFAYEAFSQFYPQQPLSEGALQLALRQVVAFERDTKEMSETELQQLLPTLTSFG